TITVTRAAMLQDIYEVTFGSGEDSTSVTMGEVQGQSVFLVKANFSGSATSEPHGILSSMTQNRSSFGAAVQRTEYTPHSGIVTQDRPDVTEFNTRPVPQSITDTSRSRSTLPGVESPQRSYSEGDTRSFWVDDGPNEQSGVFDEITATLRAVGDNSYIWIHDSVYDDSSTADDDNLLTTAQAEAMRDAFELLYPRVTNLYGYELGGGPGGDGGMDGDERISILFYDIGSDYEATQDRGVLGYFWGKDAYTQAEMDVYDLKSNEAEIFYMDAHFTDFWQKGIESTLAHEYQHMIHFNQKNVLQNIASETWFNEMLSMVAEDYLSETLGTVLYDSHPSGRISMYNNYYDYSGITDWLSGDYNIVSYSSAYLFGGFLARNYGGAELINQLSTNNKAGIASINAALQTLGYTEDFQDIMEEYAKLHVYPTGHGVLNKDFSGGEQAFGGITYNLPTFDLFSTEVNGGPGPIVFDPADYSGLNLRPYGFQVWQSAEWDTIADEEITIHLDKPNGSNVRLFLMKK
ncbi:MAG: M30 family zinc metallopeptidase, partial [Spirochaeta sp.]